MRLQYLCRFCKVTSFAVLSVGISLPLTPLATEKGSSRQQEPPPRSEVGLEIRLAGGSRPLTRFVGPGSTVIPRRLLRIINPGAAGDFTAVHVKSEAEADRIRVSLSIVYGDFSNQESLKDKREKTVSSYWMRAGESSRSTELEEFGIEPIEMKAMDAKPVVLKPGEGPRITNSPTLEVEKLEKNFDFYRVWLKNKSDKNIVAYSISTGRGSVQTGTDASGRGGVVLAAGATSRELYLYDPEIEANGIAVLLVVFEDGAFEGDPRLAAQYFARVEGLRIQSPSVLRMIEQTNRVDDSDLRDAFVKLESELWIIPEALGKPSALQFLKTRFPSEDEKSLSALYEVFKGGLYDARNIALSSLGDTLRDVQDLERRGQYASAVESIRRTLERLRETLGRITSTPR